MDKRKPNSGDVHRPKCGYKNKAQVGKRDFWKKAPEEIVEVLTAQIVGHPLAPSQFVSRSRYDRLLRQISDFKKIGDNATCSMASQGAVIASLPKSLRSTVNPGFRPAIKAYQITVRR